MKENIEGKEQKWPLGRKEKKEEEEKSIRELILAMYKGCVEENIEENIRETINGYMEAMKEEGESINVDKMIEEAREEARKEGERKIKILERILNLKKKEIANLSYPASLIGLNIFIECEKFFKNDLLRLVKEENPFVKRVLEAIEVVREIRKELGKNIFKEKSPGNTVEEWEIEVTKRIDKMRGGEIENAYKQIFAKAEEINKENRHN